jgi:type I restriction enzyme, S subunit
VRSHWPEVTVSEVCDQIIDCVNKTAPTVTGPTPYKMIRTTNVRGGWVETQNVKYVDEEVYRRWTRRGEPRPGDVILTREAPLGEVGMIRSSEPILLGQRLVMYRADPSKLDNRFLLYSMLDTFVQNQIAALGSGATVEHMRVPDCERLRLRFPPLPTQQTIASVLSAYDQLIENNRRRIQILEQMSQTIYREWFTRFGYPGHEDVPLADSDLGPIPAAWKVSTVGTASTVVTRGISPKYDDGSSLMVINQKCIRGGRLALEKMRRHKSKVPEEKTAQFGDVLINSTGIGTLGRIAQVYEDLPGITVDSHVTIVRPDPSIVTVDYFGMAMLQREAEFAAMGTGSTGQSLVGRGYAMPGCLSRIGMYSAGSRRE